jgi:hypothetical protein
MVKLATRLIIEETLEAGDAVGRDYYEHGAEPGSGYRNGYRPGRLETAEGVMDYSAPQVAGKPEPYRSAIREHVKGQTQVLEGPQPPTGPHSSGLSSALTLVMTPAASSCVNPVSRSA